MTPEQREELKPCPFCGDTESQTVEHVEGKIIHPAYFVKCDNCGAVGPTTDKGNHRELWSQRAQVEALTVPQGWKCVPVEPTVEMCEAAASFGGPGNGYNSLRGSEAVESYRHMLGAAPTIPAIPGMKEDTQ